MKVLVLLGRHEFQEALAQATKLNQDVPDDIVVWGYLADANMGLGEYAEAEKDAQWILDLRRGSTLGFIKAAALREVFGDVEGASEFYAEALIRTSPNDLEERSWLMTRNAQMLLAAGNAKQADEWINKAMTSSPESQFTSRTLADLRDTQGNYQEEVRLRQQIAEKTPTSKNLYWLAVALSKNGKAVEADAAFREFEKKARGEQTASCNANRELIFYYADQRAAAAQALEIATKEIERRHDVATLDAYAWALYRNGKFEEANQAISRALAPGIREGRYFCHALRNARARNDGAAARRFEQQLSGFPPGVCEIPAEVSR